MAEIVERIFTSDSATWTPAANTTLYGPLAALEQVVISSLIICNRSADTATVRIAISAGATPSASEWIYYDLIIPGKDTFAATLGAIVAAGQYIVGFSPITSSLSIQAWGVRVTP